MENAKVEIVNGEIILSLNEKLKEGAIITIVTPDAHYLAMLKKIKAKKQTTKNKR